MIIKIIILALTVLGCKADASRSELTVYNEPTLIGGRDAEDGEFPDVVYISAGSSRCSATVVGPQVLLTAAHCVRDGGSVTWKANGESYRAKCNRHPNYPREDADVALCEMSSKWQGDQKTSIGKAAQRGDKVTLMGYGCVRKGGGGGNDGQLRVGDAQVTGFNAYDFIADRGSALCFGDSGGPAMYHLTDSFQEHHYVIGVNSKGNIRTTSYLTRTDHSFIMSFFRDWIEEKGLEVCGINLDCEGSTEPPPPEPPQPPSKTCGDLFSDIFTAINYFRKQCIGVLNTIEIGGVR